MLDLKDLTPTVRRRDGDIRLFWRVGADGIETDFDRFRPVGLAPNPTDGALEVTWRDFGDLALDDPFFKISIERAGLLPNAAAPFKTPLGALAGLARQGELLPFKGAIFHMGRTGSTLIHRLLSRTGKVHGLSEVTLLDRAAHLTRAWPRAPRASMLRDLVASYRRPRRPNERHFVMKMTDALGSVRLPCYRAAFPEVPWVFVYRDPVEVMVSALRNPTGMLDTWVANRDRAAKRLSMPELADPRLAAEDFIARTLQRFCASAVEGARAAPAGSFLAVPYERLPDAIWETIAPHFGIALTARDRDLMREEARFSAKRIDLGAFSPDGPAKRREASTDVIALANRFVAPVVEELRALPGA